MKFYYILLLCAVCSVSSDEESEEELARANMFRQLSRIRTVIASDYQLVTRHILSNLYLYRNYRTVSNVFYPIPQDVAMARFTFQSEELHYNSIGSCSPESVVIDLKYGSYPAVNPDGYKFPKKFIDPHRREKIHTIELLSDGVAKQYFIQNPQPGNWYALVYVKWQDPKTYQVGQQGLIPDCRTTFYTDLQVRRAKNLTLTDCYNGAIVNYPDAPVSLKCFSKNDAAPINFPLTVKNVPLNYSKILIKINPLTLPTDDRYIISCTFDPKIIESQTIIFEPNPDAWHYMTIDYIDEKSSKKHADCESYNFRAEEDTQDISVVDLMRDEKGKFFTFQYGVPTTDLQDATSLINLTSSEVMTVRFEVNQFLDIGGSLSIEASLLMSLKYYMGYKRQLKKGALLGFTKDSQYFKVVICVNNMHPSVPLESGQCKYNDKVERAMFVLNSTDSESIYDNLIIPFPESGTWYASLRLFCDHTVCPCPTSHNGTRYYVKDNRTALDVDEEDISTEMSNETWTGGNNCNATVVLSLTSDSCVSGRCSNHGTCQLNTMGGHIISYCNCRTGYGAWDCSDASRLDGTEVMLVSVLLLTLSNLLFILSVYIAIIRHYYTEALMYTFTMLFSTFYHACDAPPEVNYCILKANLLQFGDFYCGLMAFWVTLMAMAILTHKVRSSLQLFGAIIIAIMTTWNMHNLLTFLLPVAMGAIVLLISWGMDYRKIRKINYPTSYYRIYMPVGLSLVSVGLICYAFLQTEQNYKFVHSLWHMVVAVSVIFLLPDVKRTGVNPFLPSENYFKTPLRRIRERSRSATIES